MNNHNKMTEGESAAEKKNMGKIEENEKFNLKRADFFILKERGYERRVEDEHGIYHSEVIPGFWIKVEWLWNLPPVLDVVNEMKLIHIIQLTCKVIPQTREI